MGETRALLTHVWWTNCDVAQNNQGGRDRGIKILQKLTLASKAVRKGETGVSFRGAKVKVGPRAGMVERGEENERASKTLPTDGLGLDFRSGVQDRIKPTNGSQKNFSPKNEIRTGERPKKKQEK